MSHEGVVTLIKDIFVSAFKNYKTAEDFYDHFKN